MRRNFNARSQSLRHRSWRSLSSCPAGVVYPAARSPLLIIIWEFALGEPLTLWSVGATCVVVAGLWILGQAHNVTKQLCYGQAGLHSPQVSTALPGLAGSGGIHHHEYFSTAVAGCYYQALPQNTTGQKWVLPAMLCQVAPGG